MVLPVHELKLGKHDPRHDARTLRLSAYATDLAAPPSVHWAAPSYGMFGNDRAGDCVQAGAAHAEQIWTHLTARPFGVTDKDVLDWYSALTGYNQLTGDNDNGTDMLSACTAWRSPSIHDADAPYPHKYSVSGFTEVNVANAPEVRYATWQFGGVYLGAQLPLSAQNQMGDVWDVITGPDAQPGSWGGHCIWVNAYDADTLTCVTWGTEQKMTWNWFHTYADEAYAILARTWCFGPASGAGQAPSGFAFAKLKADLKLIT
jgi:hypothetical protein